MTRYLVTSALPYANGPQHFGHMVGAYLPADVYVRTLRMQGEDVRFICGTDEHGVAITIGAEREGVPYASYVAHWREVIHSGLRRLGIEFDIFSGTSTCPFHAELSQEFFRRLDDNGYLSKRSSAQLYCPRDEKFLADRYVEGTCPKCGYERARGDECPRCGSWIDPLEMPVARCSLCGTTPERRETVHWYLDLPKLRDEAIGRWVAEHEWKPNVRAFISNLLDQTQPRPITRDMAWGVPVPPDRAGGERGKVLYVWFDAPIGYISFTREWAAREGRPEAWKDYWLSSDTRLVHFIGKDNIPFHCFVFPAMLYGVKQDYVLPWQVPANEFYNLEGDKFSTSRGWSIPLESFFERYDAEAARFYLLASSPETKDTQWLWEEFQQAVNGALADTIGNLATRVLRFVARHFEGRIPALAAGREAELDRVLLSECGAFGDPAEAVRAFRFRRAAEQLVENGRVANVFVDRTAPWTLVKTDREAAASVLATCCDWLGWMALWMAPILPGKAQALWWMLGQAGEVSAQAWPGVPRPGSWRRLAPGTPLGTIEALFAKIDDATIRAEVEALRARSRA
ncbi:MAG TPA: methionine--tRNA ligase [Planctomycetota bacterium]|nr:methionine--tRNA ligase [Planctomycetota bacterium]